MHPIISLRGNELQLRVRFRHTHYLPSHEANVTNLKNIVGAYGKILGHVPNTPPRAITECFLDNKELIPKSLADTVQSISGSGEEWALEITSQHRTVKKTVVKVLGPNAENTKLYDAWAEYGSGVAFCSHADQFVRATGRQKALTRALASTPLTTPERRAVWESYRTKVFHMPSPPLPSDPPFDTSCELPLKKVLGNPYAASDAEVAHFLQPIE